MLPLRDFQFLFLLAINSAPPSSPPPFFYRLFYFFCLGAGTCPRDGILLHIPFSLLSRERGGGGEVCKDETASAPLPHTQPPGFAPRRPPPTFPFQPRSNYRGFGGISSALFHMAQIPKAIKNIFLLKRKRKAVRVRGFFHKQHSALILGREKSRIKAFILTAYEQAKRNSLFG